MNKLIVFVVFTIFFIINIPTLLFGYECSSYRKTPDFNDKTKSEIISEIYQYYADGLSFENNLLKMSIVPPNRIPALTQDLNKMSKKNLIKLAHTYFTYDSVLCVLYNKDTDKFQDNKCFYPNCPQTNCPHTNKYRNNSCSYPNCPHTDCPHLGCNHEKCSFNNCNIPDCPHHKFHHRKKPMPILSIAGFGRGFIIGEQKIQTGFSGGVRAELSLSTIIDIGDYFDIYGEMTFPKIELKENKSNLTSMILAGGIALKPPRYYIGNVSLGLALGVGFWGANSVDAKPILPSYSISGFNLYIEGNIIHFDKIPMGLYISYGVFDPWDDLAFSNGKTIVNTGNSPFQAVSIGLRISPWFK